MAFTLLGAFSLHAQGVWQSSADCLRTFFCAPMGVWLYPDPSPECIVIPPQVDSLLVELQSSDAELGIVLGSGRYPKGETVLLSAVPIRDVYFAGWSDDVDDNPRELVVDKAYALTAIFRRCASASDEQVLDELGASIQVRGHRVYVKGAAGYRLSIYDERGRTIVSERRADNREVGYYVEYPGIYYVQIGAATAQRFEIK